MVIRTFHFHGSQLGRAMADFNAAGFLVHDVQPIGNGMYAVVVSLPPSIGAVDWATMDGWQQRRRRRWRFPSVRRLAAIAAVLACLIAGGWLLYGAIMPDLGNAQAAAQPGFWGFTLPDLPKEAPAIEPAKPLTDAIAKPIEDIKAAVTMALWLAGTVAALALLWFLRRPLAALGSGLAGLGRMLGRKG